jgi:hypothetical protein
MVQPGVSKNDTWVSEIGDKKRLDPFFVSLSYTELNVPLNNSSLVFHPVHIVNLSWPWEERCLDLEGFGETPVNEVFGSSAVNESFLFGCSA